MTSRARDWLRQAEADRAHARHAQRDAHYEWACFAAHQAAESAAKSAHMALGQKARGHALTELLDALRPSAAGIDDDLLDRVRALDKFYIPTRDPNFFAHGAPVDYYTRSEAERAIADAGAVLEACRSVISLP